MKAQVNISQVLQGGLAALVAWLFQTVNQLQSQVAVYMVQIQKLEENIVGLAMRERELNSALMSSVGAGIQSLNAVLTTLTGIDDRMNSIEYEFTTLKESTMVSNDIAVLYEKINDLEMAASNLGRANEQIAYLQSEINSLRQDVMDSGWDLDQKYIPEKWEWTDLNSKSIRLETQIQGLEQRMWELDTLDDRITWLESNR